MFLPKVGYALPLTPALGFWFRGGQRGAAVDTGAVIRNRVDSRTRDYSMPGDEDERKKTGLGHGYLNDEPA